MFARRSWKKELREKEEHRRVVGQMKAARKRKKHKKQPEKTHQPIDHKSLGNAWPSAPEREEDPPTHDLYPDLGPTLPPYHENKPAIQAPVMQIKEGIVSLEELQGDQLEKAKRYMEGEI